MDKKAQKDVDRLARVRNNQRNSRARKQEYVKELEQRLSACEEKAQQQDISHRLAAQKVEAENRHLKDLLGRLGVSAGSIEQYLQQANTDMKGKIAIPAIQRSNKAPHPELTVTKRVAECADTEPPATDITESTQNLKPEEKDPSFCGCRDDGQATTSDEDVLNSTLCAIAEEMISQYNTKGIDVEEIRQRIWSGFRPGVNGTGCRVQNHVLFQVLDDISGDV
ncbi:unnamed protein product [Penicillium salamii]|uniref:BZIP domain-containing protein n=1 Tax=Penicillium salamii TaxID=1612424 RepID=A0A9W4J745_9EURO|nr:unnamed protein product [Penicillium salamii]CAG8110017.1 unnamed protein product [Penicillium salamii]CAG8114099.1 unnamed protein product [Penicillium salamii]CAG8174849.1 unnamed protein product [Penicillium salamii]CAG8182412.1 unnamed protein product [Penicillium salamii]